jgi:hypothetical protein
MAPERALREHEHAIPGDFEYATTPLHQLDGSVWKCISNLGRQTGGPGLVISNDAVADRDVHAGGEWEVLVRNLAGLGRKCVLAFEKRAAISEYEH